MSDTTIPKRTPTEREEFANVLSHGLGLVLAAFVGLPLLIVSALHANSPRQLVGGIVFGLSLALLYAASTIYHLLPVGRAKAYCRLLDHSAIFVLIAGTYTPFALGPLRGAWGWGVLAVAWGLAAVGVTLKFRFGFRFEFLSTVIYLLMGWMVLAVLQPLIAGIGMHGFYWLLAGGLSYSLGVVFFVWERLRYSHLYWHGFVLVGSLCHFVAVAGYA